MNELVLIENNEPVTTTMLIAQGVDMKHEHVMKLLKNSAKKSTLLYGFEIRKVSTKGRPINAGILNEQQATFLITLMSNSEKVFQFKEKLVTDFYDMRSRLASVMANRNNAAWIESRESGKLARREGTDIIAEFVSYAESQGSKFAGMYYANISKMENKALWMLEGKFKNVREILNGQQLQVIASADLIAARALQRGMNQGLHYKEIYQLAKSDVEKFSELIGKTPVPLSVSFTTAAKIDFKDK